MKWLRFVPLVAVLGGVLFWLGYTPSQAQVCAPQEPQTSLQYLRRLSLDLRGHVPTVSEMQSVASKKAVSDDLVNKMLESPEFLKRVQRYHKDLLWGNLQTARFKNTAWALGGNGTTSPYFITSIGRRRYYRGTYQYGGLNGKTRTMCLYEPAVIKNGVIQTTTKQVAEANGVMVTGKFEGYVEIAPYWAPTTKVKVCAFDAQALAKGPHVTNGRDVDCSISASSAKCGCGPNLRWCLTNTVENTLRASMLEQSLRFASDIVKFDRPYTDVVLAKDMEVNGPIAHYLRYQTHAAGGLMYANPIQNYSVPTTLKYETQGWVRVQRKALHAGILTMPLYLIKFSSNRGRANRFFNAFLCSHFQAPAGGLPAASDKCHEEPDLMKRCGCKYCHQTLEPASSYWGRWAEAGIAPLNPGLANYPPKKSECATDAKARGNATCRRFYFIAPNDPKEERYRGMLLSYVFATEPMKANIEAGPLAIAQKHVANGDFAACTAKKMWTWILGKAPFPQQEERVSELAAAFKKNNYNMKSLIKAIVTSPEYQQGRLLNR